MAGKLKEPRVITDHRREPVCILPAGVTIQHTTEARSKQRCFVKNHEKTTKITGSWCIALCCFPGVISRYTLCVLCASVVNKLRPDFILTTSAGDRIWQRFEEKGEALSHDDLRELFHDEPALVPRTGQ